MLLSFRRMILLLVDIPNDDFLSHTHDSFVMRGHENQTVFALFQNQFHHSLNIVVIQSRGQFINQIYIFLLMEFVDQGNHRFFTTR